MHYTLDTLLSTKLDIPTIHRLSMATLEYEESETELRFKIDDKEVRVIKGDEPVFVADDIKVARWLAVRLFGVCSNA